MKSTNRLVLVAGAISAVIPVVSLAQSESGVPADARSSGGSLLEEIVVTAQRRSESLQDVPSTVTAFGADEIQRARLQQLDDVAMRTPGLSFDAFPATQPRLSIRGIGSSDRGAAGDPSAAVFLDEVYLGRPAAIAVDAFDIQRIEVLKGPQGTLYGRNVVGGGINIVTASPDLHSFGASFEGTTGNYSRAEGAGFVNIPLAEGMAAVRASGAVRTHEGYVESNFTGGELDDQRTKSVRIQGLVEPTENLQFSLAFDSTEDDSNGPAQYVLDLDADDPLSAFWEVRRDRDENYSQIDGFQYRDTSGLRAQAIWDFSGVTFNYLASSRELEYETYYDFDGGSPDMNVVSIAGGNREDTEFDSHELRLQSPAASDTAWIVGLYRYTADTVRDDILDLGLAAPPQREIFNQAAELESHAIYGDLTYPVDDRLNLIAGIRYTEDEKTYSVSTTQSEALFRAEETFDVTANETWDAVTWRLGADYHLDEDHMIYFMASRGFKSGGFQDTPGSADEAVDSFEPEFATQYEIGQRGQFLEGRLTWNNSIFWMDYTDLQTRQAVGLTITTDNAGAATIRGYETALSWLVGDALSVDMTYSYTSAVFDAFIEDGNDYSGNRISRTPKHKFVLSPSYQLLLDGGSELRFGVDYQYASRIYDDNSNVGPEQRDPTHFVDARVIYTSQAANWSVSAWGKNLTDERTRTFQAVFLGANFGAYNPPRTYGLTLRWDY